MLASLRRRWERFWMHFAGVGITGRFATRLASAFAPPYMARFYLARLTHNAVSGSQAVIQHDGLELGAQSFIADRVIVYKAADGGSVKIGDCAHVLRDCVLETGQGGNIAIGSDYIPASSLPGNGVCGRCPDRRSCGSRTELCVLCLQSWVAARRAHQGSRWSRAVESALVTVRGWASVSSCWMG